ncbi:MAG TPA: right-handed parallel beta-helix repeat-containing protein [Usitatibacter sp.]|nr:right-handed parallel beta-helix repeat-containing protein [Usitatibacter sp.]
MLAALVASGAANAQAFRAYLASYGNDANPCTAAAPCRLLPAALNAVADGGQVWILDSANFNQGTINVTKSVSILAIPGAVGSVVAVGGAPAMSIGVASLKVGLRNLVFANNALSPGTDGVVVTAGSRVSLEGCLLENLPGTGVRVAGQGATVNIENTTFRDMGGGSVSAAVGAKVSVVASRMLGGVPAIFAAAASAGTASISVVDSTIAGGDTEQDGISVDSSASNGNALIDVSRSSVLNSGTALRAWSTFGNAIITVSGSIIANNQCAFAINGSGAAVQSFGNNHFSNNFCEGGALTQAPLR